MLNRSCCHILQVQLSTGKLVRMEKLRGFSRCIIFAGTPSHVTACLAAAEPNKERLLERGVTLVPLPLFGAEEVGVPPVPEGEDKRWRVTPVRLGEWESWLLEQMRLAGERLSRADPWGLLADAREKLSTTPGIALPSLQGKRRRTQQPRACTSVSASTGASGLPGWACRHSSASASSWHPSGAQARGAACSTVSTAA